MRNILRIDGIAGAGVSVYASNNGAGSAFLLHFKYPASFSAFWRV